MSQVEVLPCAHCDSMKRETVLLLQSASDVIQRVIIGISDDLQARSINVPMFDIESGRPFGKPDPISDQ